jgi:hypothetical protein
MQAVGIAFGDAVSADVEIIARHEGSNERGFRV